jgi:hypothetical protein
MTFGDPNPYYEPPDAVSDPEWNRYNRTRIQNICPAPHVVDETASFSFTLESQHKQESLVLKPHVFYLMLPLTVFFRCSVKVIFHYIPHTWDLVLYISRYLIASVSIYVKNFSIN